MVCTGLISEFKIGSLVFGERKRVSRFGSDWIWSFRGRGTFSGSETGSLVFQKKRNVALDRVDLSKIGILTLRTQIPRSEFCLKHLVIRILNSFLVQLNFQSIFVRGFMIVSYGSLSCRLKYSNAAMLPG